MVGIYKITSPSGKVYIGQSWNIASRFSQYGSTHIRRQPKLFASLKKYGKSAHRFDIVHELPADIDQLTLDMYEHIYLEQFKDCGFEMLNIKGAGSRGKMAPESIAKTVATKRANGIKFGGMLGKKASAETRKKQSEAAKGKLKSDATKEKFRQRMLGYKAPAESRKKMSNSAKGNTSHLGHKHSPETRAKMSEKRRLRVTTPETKTKLSESLKKAYSEGRRVSKAGVARPVGEKEKISAGLKQAYADGRRMPRTSKIHPS